MCTIKQYRYSNENHLDVTCEKDTLGDSGYEGHKVLGVR